MKSFQIFKPGKHTSSSGQVIEFTEAMLRDAVAAYDPTVHEAPIVVGHPRTNGPAYGWVKSLAFDESGAIVAEPHQVEAEFGEMVEAGRFKKRSASWYLPDAPNNPTPGKLHLRHVGFLGAQPPAIKGLKEVEFGEAEAGVVDFSMADAWALQSIADVFRSFREWLIAYKGVEVADRVVPGYAVDTVRSAYEKELADAIEDQAKEESKLTAMPSYSEEEAMTIEQLQAQVAALTAERDALKAKEASFGEAETSLQAREAAVAEGEAKIARAAVEARIDAAVKAGRVLPAQKAHHVSFAMGLADKEATVDFGEGDKAEKVTQRDAYLRALETGPKLVEFGELSGAAAGGQPGDKAADPQATAEKARDLVKARAAEGKTLSFTEAVAEVMATDAA